MNNRSRSARILVIDDDELSREVFSMLLQRQGYRVKTAESGQAALLHLSGSEDDQPKIILADLQMPGVAGSELARQLRAVCGTGTILLAMSAGEPVDGARDDFDGFLLKPFTMDDLAAMIAGNSDEKAESASRESFSDLDEVIYNKLAAAMRKEKLEQLYALFLGDAEKRAEAMRGAASEGDDDTYRRQAHAIRGGCGMVGAAGLQKLATSMENQGLGATNHVATLDEFMMGCERLRRILIAREDRAQISSLSGEATHE